MIRDIMELQLGCKAVACVILDSEFSEFRENEFYAIEADISDSDLYRYGKAAKWELEMFLTYALLPKNTPCYLIIRNIDKVSADDQRRFVSLVKDRGFHQLDELLDDYVIVFTVSEQESLKKIIPELYQFCVDCIGTGAERNSAQLGVYGGNQYEAPICGSR